MHGTICKMQDTRYNKQGKRDVSFTRYTGVKCVLHILVRFYPSTFDTTSACADLSILERFNLPGHRTTTQRCYIVMQ